MLTAGHRLTLMRTFAGLSQAELANLIGASHQYLSELESDRYQPRLSTLDWCARFFAIHAEWLLNGTLPAFTLPAVAFNLGLGSEHGSRRRAISHGLDQHLVHFFHDTQVPIAWHIPPALWAFRVQQTTLILDAGLVAQHVQHAIGEAGLDVQPLPGTVTIKGDDVAAQTLTALASHRRIPPADLDAMIASLDEQAQRQAEMKRQTGTLTRRDQTSRRSRSSRSRRLALLHDILGERDFKSLGISERRWQALLNGRLSMPRVVSDRIAECYNVNCAWLRSGQGWAFSLSSPTWLRDALSKINAVIIVSDGGCEWGLLLARAGDILPIHVGEIGLQDDQDPTTQTYRAVLETLRTWNGKVGRVILAAHEAVTVDDLDLSTLLSRAIYAEWILDDEVARLKPRGALIGERVDRYSGRPRIDAISSTGPTPVEPGMLKTIAARDPELAAILELLEDSDAKTRAKVYKFLLTSRQAANALADQLTAAIQHVSQAEPPPRTVQRRGGRRLKPY